MDQPPSNNPGDQPGADAGPLPSSRFQGYGRAGETGCGAAIAVGLRFAGQGISEAWAAGKGSDEAVAAAAALSGLVEGHDWRQAAALSPEAMAAGLSESDHGDSAGGAKGGWELPGASQRGRSRALVAAGFAVEALQRALEDALGRGTFPEVATVDENTVLVAMSGGVDSSVACLKELERGREVIGLTMRLWSDPDCSGDTGTSCCSPLSIRDARAVCHQLGVPHLTIDLSAEFAAQVVEPFFSAYLGGLTPNPCTACNGGFRFPALVALADRLGAGLVATGHYAGIRQTPAGMLIGRGADPDKDQSYMLWAIPPSLMPRLELPLAALRKDETRAAARAADLPTQARPESQDICFIPDGDHRRFLRSRAHDLPGRGPIVDSAGRPLGEHTGYIDYTVGQRRGLGGGASEPLFVLGTRPRENVVVAGSCAELEVRQIVIDNVNLFVSLNELLPSDELTLQVRYRSAAVPARLLGASADSWQLEALSPLYGVAPGQSAVLYRADEVVAGGVIVAAS